MDSSPSFNAGFVQRAMKHWDDGGIVQMSCFFPNPAGGGANGTGNATEILKLGSPQNQALMRSFDQAAGPLQQFKGHGMAVLFRPFLEMDGNWFWWGRNSFNAVQFNELWRQLYRYYTTTKGFDHLLWVFAVNGGPLAYNFVGEDVVNIVGVDGYTDNPDSQAYTNLYNRLRQEAPNLLVSWAEFGSGTP
jgi:beta-mannanase